MKKKGQPAPKKPDPMSAQIRIAAAVIIVTMVVWMGASLVGGMIGLPARYAFLLDFAALAAFFWALFVLYQVWRKRQQTKD
jgi:hypothetical protein